MAFTPRNYANNKQLSATAVTIVPIVKANTQSVVRKLSFYNSGLSNRTITVHIVQSGGTIATTNIEAKRTITPGKTWIVIEIQGEVLETGMLVQAVQDAGTDVNINCSGTDKT